MKSLLVIGIVATLGFTYYDYSNCTIKVYDEKGRGRVSKCFY
ncbi:hypothetical protein CCAND93_120067 [Capnocytophaga canis]|uniref:Uncharacterized protein n=1 Tax=Capnocytophaga canis TaxID=1848903 RepID=A0A0B7IL96_9FLAO|nr:hypothetical protein CCAND93_120067 [Capnocytophaga canis]